MTEDDDYEPTSHLRLARQIMELTPHGTRDLGRAVPAGDPEGAGAPDDVITPDMIGAAVLVLEKEGVAQDLLEGFITPWEVADQMLRAAVQARAKVP